MAGILGGLRGWTAALVLVQCASLSVFFPRDCCQAHRPADAAHHGTGATGHGSHEADEAHHGQTSARGKVDAGHAHDQQGDTRVPHANCRLQSRCEGPQALLTTVLSNQGMPGHPIAFPPDLRLVGRLVPAVVTNTTFPLPPDTPPPRV